MRTDKPNFRFIYLVSTLFMLSPLSHAQEPDANQRKFVAQGMQQGEVVKKIGLPDYQTSFERIQPCYSVVKKANLEEEVVVTQCGQPIKVETWTFNPAPHDNQIMTVITFENGTVTNIVRDVSR